MSVNDAIHSLLDPEQMSLKTDFTHFLTHTVCPYFKYEMDEFLQYAYNTHSHV